MKTSTFLIAVVTVLCTTFIYAGKVKQVGQWTLNATTLKDYDYNSKGTLLVIDQETNVNGKIFVTLYKKDKKSGPFEVVGADGADCVSINYPLKLSTFMLKIRKGSTHTFYVFSIGKSLKELGKFVTDTNNKCCPNMYYGGSKFYFKQRNEEGEPEHVRLAMLDKKLNVKMDELVQTSNDGCVWYSPNYKYVTVCAAVDATGNSSLQLYKTGNKLVKLTDGDIKSQSSGFSFYGKNSKIVIHQNSYDDASNKSTYEEAKIGSYKPQFDFVIDDSVDSYYVDSKGNILIVYTNNTISVVTAKGTSGPFAIPETIGADDSMSILQFAKNKVLIRIRKEQGSSADTMYLCLYSIGKNGLNEKGKTGEMPYKWPVIFGKYIYIFHYNSTADTYELIVYKTSNLKEAGPGLSGSNPNWTTGSCYGKYFIVSSDSGTWPNNLYTFDIYTFPGLKSVDSITSTTWPSIGDGYMMISTVSGTQQTLTLHSW